MFKGWIFEIMLIEVFKNLIIKKCWRSVKEDDIIWEYDVKILE